MQKVLRYSDSNFQLCLDRVLAERNTSTGDIIEPVRRIIEGVQEKGDKALLEYTKRYDGVSFDPADLMVPVEEINYSYDKCARRDLEALEFAAERIGLFHKHQLPESFSFTDDLGVGLGAKWTPLKAVGIYVPGGKAVYPSSLLMNAIPAKMAGVDRVAMTVPCPDGAISPYLLAAAKISGVAEIYKIGGAQAIAALAYGTETIPRVDKIVGPGNAFVAEAKRQVFGMVGIDSIAGPSEILVVADGETDAEWVAIDLLSQAEHDVDAKCTLITDDTGLVEKVHKEINDILGTLERGDIASKSWERNGMIIIVEQLDDAAKIINQIAPEHVELAVSSPKKLVDSIKNAGAIFVGRHTPEAIGDYVAGPNHVLPTSGSARFTSGLSVLDFFKCTNLVECSRSGLKEIGPSGITLAEREGLGAHARSIAVRLSSV